MKVDAPGADDVEGGFAGVVDGFAAGAVDGAEVEDFVFAVGVSDQVPQDGVHGCSCVGDVYYG